MPLVSRVRPKLGDIIEIPTSRGLAYAQYTHNNSEYGSLLRALPGFNESRLADFAELARRPPAFSFFYPLGAACNRKMVAIVANEPIAEHNEVFPTFRSRLSTNHKWWLWDGLNSWSVTALSEKQLEEIPPSGIWNHALLVERIEQDWRHEHFLGPMPPKFV